MKKETSSHLDSKSLTTTTNNSTTPNNDPTALTTMTNLPFPFPTSGPTINPQAVNTHVNGIITHVTGLGAEVQKMALIPEVSNQQVLDFLNTLVQGQNGIRADIQGLADKVGILDRRLQQVEERTGDIDNQMLLLNTNMETLSSKVDDCDGGLRQVDGGLQQIEDRMQQVDGRLQQVEGSIQAGEQWLTRIDQNVTDGFDGISAKLQAANFNTIARAENGHARKTSTSLLAPLHNVETNEPIEFFPSTLSELTAMDPAHVRAILQELGAPTEDDAESQAMINRLRLVISSSHQTIAYLANRSRDNLDE